MCVCGGGGLCVSLCAIVLCSYGCRRAWLRCCFTRQDTFGKSDPFVRFSRVNEDGGAIPVFKTEVVMNNLNPTVRRWGGGALPGLCGVLSARCCGGWG
jgi:hypothetical protein